MTIQHDFAAVNGETIHFAHQGSGRPIIFLHGFPAFWYAWKDQLEQFGQSMWAIAPDGRGVNRSCKPADVDAYRIEILVSDVVGLADHLGIDQFVLVGHDWGGALAWEVAQRYPKRVSKLIVANAPPWAAFMHSLATMPEQREASSYMDRLKAPTAETLFLAENAERLWQVSFAPLVDRGYYSDEHKEHYLKCWQTPGSLAGFLNWYRANVPTFDQIDREKYRPTSNNQIETPTLLLWGEQERAFTRPLLNSIPDYCSQLEIQLISGANHWIHLEQPKRFKTAIEQFI